MFLLLRPSLAAICSNWKDAEKCKTSVDGGCNCGWEDKDKVCVKTSDCPEGGIGITSVVEPSPSPSPSQKTVKKMYLWSGDPSQPGWGEEVQLEVPCMQCRRAFTKAETDLMDKCRKKDWEVEYCKCFDIYCSGPPYWGGQKNLVTENDAKSGGSGRIEKNDAKSGGEKLAKSTSNAPDDLSSTAQHASALGVAAAITAFLLS